MINPKEIFDFLQGTWVVDKEIRHCEEPCDEAPVIGALSRNDIVMDCRAEPVALLAMTITGSSSFEPTAINTLLYSEELELQKSIWHQKYQYKYDPTENTLHKYFANGDYFYELIVEKNRIYGSHKCLADQYDSEYEFLNDNEMSILYKIKRPQKNHEILTYYRRRYCEE